MTISRRDFMNGVAVAAGATLHPTTALANAVVSTTAVAKTSHYPPLLDGMRGNHDGSYEVIHQLAMGTKSSWGKTTQLDEHYDLVVVGAGVSGIAAAHFYRKKHPDATILILDNHDDFGGHCKRNEFQVGDKTIIGYGGSQTLQEPNFYTKNARQFIADLGIDLEQLAATYDTGFFTRHGLRSGTQFQTKAWGVNRFVAHDMGYFDGFMPLVKPTMSVDEMLKEFPVSDAVRTELKILFTIDEDKLPGLSEGEKWRVLAKTSYRDFVQKIIGLNEEGIFDILEHGTIDRSRSLGAISAESAMGYGGLPGWGATGISWEEIEGTYLEPYVHHFPDGNASVTRLAIRQMIPSVAEGSTMEDVVTAKFDYTKLDVSGNKVRMRLNSPVVRVEHDGPVAKAKQVIVTYVNNGNTFEVTAGSVIMACNNRVIPKVCPEFPEQQKQALSELVKTPIIYTTVLLRNWHAWKKLGIGGVISPRSYHITTSLDFPCSIGDYQFAKSPNEPIIVHMERFPYPYKSELDDISQLKQSRYELLTTPFQTIEQETRQQLSDLLIDGGFEHDRDILGITVNRWSHGYATRPSTLYKDDYDEFNDPRQNHMIGRKPLGRIAVANSDSASRAILDQAVEMGFRAVEDVT